MDNKIIIGVVVGLVIGLIVGAFIGIAVYPSTHNGAGTKNQVQVSGTVQSGIITGNTLYFQSAFWNILTTASIVNGHYSVLLTGGQTYNIYGSNPIPFEGERNYTEPSDFNPFYLPSGVTRFTENLVPLP